MYTFDHRTINHSFYAHLDVKPLCFHNLCTNRSLNNYKHNFITQTSTDFVYHMYFEEFILSHGIEHKYILNHCGQLFQCFKTTGICNACVQICLQVHL